jgi:hypothetical protein
MAAPVDCAHARVFGTSNNFDLGRLWSASATSSTSAPRLFSSLYQHNISLHLPLTTLSYSRFFMGSISSSRTTSHLSRTRDLGNLSLADTSTGAGLSKTYASFAALLWVGVSGPP